MKTRLLACAGIATLAFLAEGLWVYAFLPHQADASRNSSGTYSTPNTFVAGTVISSSSMNANFSDIATEMTDSLDRSGKGGMLAALRGIDGTVAAPAFSWTSETGSGWYRIGSSDLGLAISGTKKLELTSSLFTVTPNASFSGNATVTGTLGVTSDFAINTNKFTVTASSGNTLVGGMLGIGSAPSNWLDITISGSATTNIGNWLEASLADGNSMTLNIGKAASAGSLGIVTYTKNATAANSTLCFSIFGGSSGTFCVDGNSKTYIGASGTGTTQMNFGSCTLNGASPSVCTATVASGAKCVATDVATTAATRCIATSVTTTTLTVTSCNGNTNVVNYVCF